MSKSTFNAICLLTFVVAFIGCQNETAVPASKETENTTENESPAAETTEPAAAASNHAPQQKSVSKDQNQHENLMDSLSPVANMATTPESTLFTGSDLFVNSLRTWNDVSNTFSANAELLEVLIKKRQIRLLKENGIVVVVDYELLSEHDKNFVRQFIEYHRNQDVSSAPKLVDRNSQ